MAEWEKTVMSTIDNVVDTAQNKVVKPAHKIARFSVYGILAIVLLVLVIFFLVIAAFRATTLVLPMYGTYLVWGGIFVAIGTLLWIKK